MTSMPLSHCSLLLDALIGWLVGWKPDQAVFSIADPRIGASHTAVVSFSRLQSRLFLDGNGSTRSSEKNQTVCSIARSH